jgi:hypothetical protein
MKNIFNINEVFRGCVLLPKRSRRLKTDSDSGLLAKGKFGMIERRKCGRRQSDQDCLLTDFKVAELAMVPVNTVRYWRQMGMLPSVKVGRHPRIWLSEFQKVFRKPVSVRPWELITSPDKKHGIKVLSGKNK